MKTRGVEEQAWPGSLGRVSRLAAEVPAWRWGGTSASLASDFPV